MEVMERRLGVLHSVPCLQSVASRLLRPLADESVSMSQLLLERERVVASLLTSVPFNALTMDVVPPDARGV